MHPSSPESERISVGQVGVFWKGMPYGGWARSTWTTSPSWVDCAIAYPDRCPVTNVIRRGAGSLTPPIAPEALSSADRCARPSTQPRRSPGRGATGAVDREHGASEMKLSNSRRRKRHHPVARSIQMRMPTVMWDTGGRAPCRHKTKRGARSSSLTPLPPTIRA